jgi:probable HAF family extracellular repeat protein
VPLPEAGVPAGRAFLWDAINGLQDLGSLGGSAVEATGINEAGQIVGSSTLAGVGYEAFVWDSVTGMHGIGTLGGQWSRGAAINNLGQVTGTSTTSASFERAFTWGEGTGMRSLESGGNTETRGNALNNFGVVTGRDLGSFTNPAFPGGMTVWSEGIPETPKPLAGTFSSPIPHDINSNGLVVGDIGYSGKPEVEAFLWSHDQSFVDFSRMVINLGEWSLVSATGINDAGQIIGLGRLNGQLRGFLLNPVPEPQCIGLAVIGAFVFGIWHRWSRFV